MILALALRRASMLRLVPLTLVMAVLYAHDRPTEWNDFWFASSAHVTGSAVFLGPLAAGAAAWDAARFRRAGTAEVLAVGARTEVTRYSADISATVLWTAPPYLVVLIEQWRQMEPVAVGWPVGRLLAFGFLVITVHAGLGYLLGSSLPRFVGSAVAALGSYVWLSFPPSWDSEVSGHFSATLFGCCSISSVVDGRFLVAEAAFLLGVTLASLGLSQAVAAQQTGVRGSGRGALGGLLAAAGTAVVLLTLPTMLTPNRDALADRPPPAHPACAGVAPEVCVWPEDRDDLHSLRRAAHEVAEVVSSLGGDVPARFADRGLFPGDPATVSVASQGEESYEAFLSRFARYFLPEYPPCSYVGEETIAYPGLGIEPLLVAYLTDRAGYPETARLIAGEVLTPFLDATIAAPPDEQAAWYAANVQVMATCDHEPVLAPP